MENPAHAGDRGKNITVSHSQCFRPSLPHKVANVYSPTVHVNVIFIAEEKEEHVTATELNRQNLLHVLKIEHAFTLS